MLQCGGSGRILNTAFEMALRRKNSGAKGKVTSVDKANVLESSRLWREIAQKIAADHPMIEFENMLVDNAAMQLIRDPGQFDVIVTSNMFGDILSDEASMLTGSIGMLPSASLGKGSFGMYEPIHGSAPDIMGRNIANPIAAILSAAMMLRYSLDLGKEADAIEQAVSEVLELGYRTVDIASCSGTAQAQVQVEVQAPDQARAQVEVQASDQARAETQSQAAAQTTEQILGTKEMGDLICSRLL